MEIIIEKDPNLGRDIKDFLRWLTDASIRPKNLLLGIFVGSILLGGVIIIVAMLTYFLNLLVPS